MRSRTGGTLATIYQGFCRRLQGPGTALGLEIPGKRRRNYGCTDLSPVHGDLPGRRADERWLWPGRCSGNGQARLPGRGPDLSGLARGRAGRIGAPPASQGRPGPVRPRSTSPPRFAYIPLVDLADAAVWRRQPPGPPWLALPPARYARPRVGPGGHAGGGRYRTPRSSGGRRTVAFPALALDGLAPHLTGKGPRRPALHGPEGRPTRSDALRCPPHTGRSQADPAGLSANLRQQAPTCARSPVRYSLPLT